MDVKFTIDDLVWETGNMKNCSTCTYRGFDCPRTLKSNPNGYIKTSSGQLSAMISSCPRWKGQLMINF